MRSNQVLEKEEGGNAALLRLSALVCVLVALLVPGQVSADPIDSVADLVFGPADFVTTSGCNTGGRSASSLCTPVLIAVDAADNVYVVDRFNSRVLVYFDPLTTDTVADLVLGQPNFITGNCNTGGLSASSLCFPVGVAVDAAGNVYVGDTNNSRVLVYLDPLTTDTVADVVLGQPNFVTNSCNTGGLSASSLCAPNGVAVDAAGNVYVADTINHRVLEYNAPLTTDTVADVVFGQPNFVTDGCNTGGRSASSLCSPVGVAVDAAGNLYVADVNNSRVLEYNTPLTMGTVADLVIGQADFVTGTCNTGGLSASSLCVPREVAVDAAGNVYVGDTDNNRMLEYITPLTTDTVADVVLGQANFVTDSCNTGGVSASSLCLPLGVTVDAAGNVYVVDRGNGRVLEYDGLLSPEFTCDGFMSPFDGPLALKKKVKRAIPVQIELTDSDGFIVKDFDIASPPVINVLFNGQVFGEFPLDTDDLLPLGSANDDNIFRFDPDSWEGVWVYNLGTKQFQAAGTYTVMVASGDTSEYEISASGGACTETFERLP